MHDFIGKNGTQFFFNGDFSGDVKVLVKDKNIEKVDGGNLVDIDAVDILELVAEYIRSEKISKIEQAETEELLLGKV